MYGKLPCEIFQFLLLVYFEIPILAWQDEARACMYASGGSDNLLFMELKPCVTTSWPLRVYARW